MSLRVLLADESSTIKKVIHLSLQDFNVEVKAVSVGLDVLSVAKSFRPDIIFADVLLAKRSGYEICHDLKNDPDTASIPVVLMWSGFMEIDEQKARICGADRRLEKPFDATGIRQIVQDLVKKTQTNPVSSFVQFPPLPPFEEGAAHHQKTAAPQVHTPQAPAVPPPQQKPVIPTAPPANDGSLIIDDSEDEWVQQPIPKTAAPQKPIPPPPAAKPTDDEFTEFSLTAPSIKIKPPPQQPQPQQNFAVPQMQPAASVGSHEEIIRQETQRWLAQHMPAIAERLIRDEINRLLQESDQSIQVP